MKKKKEYWGGLSFWLESLIWGLNRKGIYLLPVLELIPTFSSQVQSTGLSITSMLITKRESGIVLDTRSSEIDKIDKNLYFMGQMF